MQTRLTGNTFPIVFKAGATESQTVQLDSGRSGTFIVPSGSEAIAKTIQFVAVDNPDSTNQYPATPLLATAKTLAAGANPLNTTEANAVGACQLTRFSLSSAVTAATTIWLLWKN